MNKNDPFNKPFFTDPNYMEKEFAKSDRLFKKAFIGYIVLMIVFVLGFAFLMFKTVEEINSQGGVAKSIGRFIKDVKTEADL